MGQRLRGRLHGWRAYALLLALAGLALLLSPVMDSLPVLAVIPHIGALLFTLWIAGFTGRSKRLALGIAVFAVAAIGIGLAIGQKGWVAAGAASAAVLAIATIVIILIQLARQRGVDGATVLGALSAYLFGGMAFAYLYIVVNLTTEPALFNIEPVRMLDCLYFSFTTLTTTGFGDLTAQSDTGKMLAVSEGVLGQLYLVTVVALAVARFGARARS